MEKPTITKKFLCQRGKHKISLVNSLAIRDTNLDDEEFGNWGTSVDYPKVVPENEIWIDQDTDPEERQFFITAALTEYRKVAAGESANKAYEAALRQEKNLREKLHHVNFVGREQRVEKAPREVYVDEYCRIVDQDLTVFLVNGEAVRDRYKLDFLEGGNPAVYNFVPKGEIWIENEGEKAEVPYVVIHEFVEYCLMIHRSESYGVAHGLASHVEFHFRSCEVRLRQLERLTCKWAFRQVAAVGHPEHQCEKMVVR